MTSLYLFCTRVARLPVAVIAGMPVIVLLTLHGHHGIFHVAIDALPIILTTMGGFVLNDLFDRFDDVARGGAKPIAAGLISVSSSTFAVGILLIGAVAIAVWSAVAASAYVICLTIAGIAMYSPLARILPYSKGIVTALLCCAPFLYASQLVGLDFHGSYYFLLITFIIGREMLLDVRDVDWDRQAKIRTAVTALGVRTSKVLGWLLMSVSLVVLTLFSSGIAQVAFAVGCISCLCAGLIYLRNPNRGIAASRATLLLATVAAALTV